MSKVTFYKTVTDSDGDGIHVEHTDNTVDGRTVRVVSTRFGHFTAAQAREYAALIVEAADALDNLEEPTGLGAVVRTASGRTFVRVENDSLPWREPDTSAYREWADMSTGATVLAEGVQLP